MLDRFERRSAAGGGTSAQADGRVGRLSVFRTARDIEGAVEAVGCWANSLPGDFAIECPITATVYRVRRSQRD